MATVTVNIPDQFVAPLLVALRANHPEHAELGDLALARRIMADLLRGEYRTYKMTQAQAAAQLEVQAAMAQADVDSVGIG